MNVKACPYVLKLMTLTELTRPPTSDVNQSLANWETKIKEICIPKKPLPKKGESCQKL